MPPILSQITKPIMLFVKTLTNQTYLVDIDKNDTVEIIKNRIGYKTNIPVYKQRLVYKGNEVKDGTPCIDIEDFWKEGLVHLIILN